MTRHDLREITAILAPIVGAGGGMVTTIALQYAGLWNPSTGLAVLISCVGLVIVGLVCDYQRS